MDIQLFENFTLAPESRMDIEIYENFALPPNGGVNPDTPPAKRAGDSTLEDERPLKRPHLSKSDLDKGVKILVEYYQLDKAQEENLIKRAKEHKFVPTI